ncbi:hypothetical protein shim_30000 [Shimia sp. SK013]|uniref:DUF3726 domain-containing protein n=1 Tax=Shimia sp. SK013 TaxID=1389006 RepID=UPI0006B513B1|nr:DUF3726 domain-containing protein [Shimia sp. SK013]KPA20753.1 hypothetical protein shim_30000 [Shimia sp. SK013]
MNLSLNEIEATAKKAARGAGHTWGIAEEAAKATRWLCSRGIDGCGNLARLLTADDVETGSSLTLETDTLRSKDGSLCPLIAGACIADRAEVFGSDGWHLQNVVSPILLVPFAAQIATRAGQSVALSASNFSAVTDGKTLTLSGVWKEHANRITLQTTNETGETSKVCTRANPDKRDWETLQSLAHRTYAPATEASRLKGAGAGMTDND